MIVLVFSDTHGDMEAYKRMHEQVQTYDLLYCLGDSGFSKEFLDDEGIISVKGNYPFAPNNPLDISEKWHGLNFFLTHGHKYHVKFGLSRIKQKADLLRMDVCLFGHTHKHYLEITGKLILVNPGALSHYRCHLFPSYSKIIIDDFHLQIQIINLNTGDIVKTYHEEIHEQRD